MAGSFVSIAFSNASTVWCASVGFRYTSVDAHQTMTIRSQPCSLPKRRMSSRSCSASSIWLRPFFTFTPSSRRT